MKPIQLRQDIRAVNLRALAKVEQNAKICRRLLAIAHLLDGGSSKDGCKIACLSDMPFRRWLHRFNAAGVEGLKNKKMPGRRPKIDENLAAALRAKVLAGPSTEEH